MRPPTSWRHAARRDMHAEDHVAPLIPLFGGQVAGAEAPATWHGTWDEAPPRRDAPERREPRRDEPQGDVPERALAEAALAKRLRTRQLSVREARTVLAAQGLDEHDVEAVLEQCARRGWLDDAGLAEQLVHSGAQRKGQGRQVIAQTLNARGIPRPVAEAALAGLPDDDFDRALAFARAKAPGLRRVAPETALRRLAAQLARRGYGSAVALSAARQACDEIAR